MYGRKCLLIIAITLACQLARGADSSPTLPALLALLRSEWKDAPAMNTMKQVYSTDRFFTFSKFAETARFLESEMRRVGLKQVEIVNAPADGKTQVGYWTEPLAWEATSATLDLMDRAVPKAQRRLADYAKTPASQRQGALSSLLRRERRSAAHQ